MNLTIKNEIGQCDNKVFLQFEGGELTGALSSGFEKVFDIQSAAESFDKKAPAVFSTVVLCRGGLFPATFAALKPRTARHCSC